MAGGSIAPLGSFVQEKLRVAGGVVLANSRDVAQVFGKEHRHVLRDIDALLHGPDLGDGWFQEVRSEHPTVPGRFDRSFDMTRDGFTLLVMGWTGERALAFKVRYIQAFNAMESQIKAGGSDDRFLAAVREIVAPLAVRFDGQDVALARVETRVDALAEDMAYVKTALRGRRRDLSAETKREHVADLRLLGGRCPCCDQAMVLTPDGDRSSFADFDHFYANSYPDGSHTWLICKPCHGGLTSGRVARDQREAEFRAYQSKRRRLPGRQPKLFG